MEIKSPAAEYLKNVTKNKSSELVSGDLDEALNNEYTNIRELAKSKKLIIQPIKALCVGFNSQQRDLSCARTAKLCSLLIHADKKKLSTVGYMIGVKHNEYVDMGISYCKPDDFPIFNRKAGMCAAFETLGCGYKHYTLKSAQYSNDRSRMYVFLETIPEQILKFVKRCNSYFFKEQNKCNS